MIWVIRWRGAFYSTGGSGGLRSPWRGGNLNNGGNAGLACANGNNGPSNSNWNGAPRIAELVSVMGT